MPKVISADMELDIAKRSLADAERKAAKCHDHVRDERAYLADVSNPKNGRSHQTSTAPHFRDREDTRLIVVQLGKHSSPCASGKKTLPTPNPGYRSAHEMFVTPKRDLPKTKPSGRL